MFVRLKYVLKIFLIVLPAVKAAGECGLRHFRHERGCVMKKLIFPLVSFLILFPTMIVLFVLMAKGGAFASFEGFAADKDGNIYIGRGAEIEVYDENRELIRSIHITAGELGKGYGFTILEGNKIFVDTGVTYDILDLDGNMLKRIDYSESDYFPFITVMKNQTKFIAADGSEYHMINNFGKVNIVRIKDGEATIAYSSPGGDTAIAVAFVVCIILIGATAAYCVLNGRKLLGFKDYERGNEQNA